MADSVGLSSDYAIDYRLSSGSVHANRPWDSARFEDSGLLVIPAPDGHRDIAIPLAFNVLRYLAWLLRVASDVGAATLYSTELALLSNYDKYMAPLDTLFAKGIVGAGALPTAQSP